MTIRPTALLMFPLVMAQPCTEPEPPVEPCIRLPSETQTSRYGVVAHPYADDASQADTWSVFSLDENGFPTTTQTQFEMGRAVSGPVLFSPDGQIGLVAQDSGTIGSFAIDESGSVQVIHSARDLGIYATSLLMAAQGDRIYALDGNWRENGGGIYEIPLGCDGRLGEATLLAEAKLPYKAQWIPGAPGEILVAADDFLDADAQNDVHRVVLDGSNTQDIGGTDAFGDEEAIVSALGISGDGQLALIGDNSVFSGVGNRVAVVNVANQNALQILTDIEDPVDLLFSPYGDRAMIVSGYGDALIQLQVDASNSQSPITVVAQVTYNGARPQLPSQAILLNSPEGGILLSENTALRRLNFREGADIEDLGIYSFGSGYTAITGAMGVQP